MLPRLTHYAIAQIFLLAMAITYQNLAAPWMQPPHVEAMGMSESRILRRDDSLEDLFPDDAWQRGLCKQLQTSEGMLLFQNWKQTSDDQWKLWPLTLVIGRGMSGTHQRDPVLLVAPEGAEIKFTESLDVMSGGAPPIHRGRLIGPVHIYRNDSAGRLRSLDLRTANVGIDNRKVWTTEAIEMRVGQARLVGRDLTIHFSGPATASDSGGNAALDRMELIYLDELVMPLQPGGLWPREPQATGQATASLEATDPTSPARPAGATEQADEAALISIQCGGRVEYDFALDQLLLHDSVSLVHQVAGVEADRFDCGSLELTLNDPTNDEIDRREPIDWLSEIVATGSPASARLPSLAAELVADRIEFHAQSGYIRAEGSRGIRLRRGGITARLARLIYMFDPQQPKVLGAIDAPGPGIVQVDDPAIPLRKAQWRDHFKLTPLAGPQADQSIASVDVSIDGDFHAWLTDGGEFQADSIQGLLVPDSSAPGSAAAKGPAGTSLVPERFKISGHVRIDTHAIAAETELLQLFFVSEPQPPGASSGRAESGEVSPLRQWVQQPSQPSALVDPVARPRPTIRGNTILAQLRRNESGLSVKDLTVSGSVEIEHHIKSGEQTLPLRMMGEQLRLIDGGGQDVLQLGSGVESPARFELADGFFVGPQIQIRPSENIVWINAAGEFQMPSAALPSGLSSDPAEGLRWVRPPHCRWQGEMIFDGREAVLTDGVDVTAALISNHQPWELSMKGDRLQVSLSEGVQVRDMKSMRRATIERVSLLQAEQRPVMVEALRRATDGVLEAKHLIHAAQLNLTPSGGGQIVGVGPGSYRGWTAAAPQQGLLGGSSRATPIDGAPRELTGIHLIFHDSMQADMQSRSLDFLRGVRVGVSPIASWEDAFDARQMDAISSGQSTLDCDRLRFNIEPGYEHSRRIAGDKTPWEMEAVSGVVFRTRNERGLLEGTASRAAYSSSKDLFTVDGAPNRPAIFRHQLPDGSKGHEGAVRTMSVRPGTMKIEQAVLERLNIATPPNLNTR
jgi:hypothetical protein